MVVTRDYLEGLNPTCYGEPAAFDYKTERSRAEALADSLKAVFLDVRLVTGEQDANFYANVSFGCGAVRLSLFGKLAVLLHEEACSPDSVAEVARRIEACGFTFVPWHFFGEPFKTRKRINGDLFNQLFDYQ